MKREKFTNAIWGALDDIQPGILLYPLLDETGDERYKKALDTLLAAIKDFPRNEIRRLLA